MERRSPLKELSVILESSLGGFDRPRGELHPMGVPRYLLEHRMPSMVLSSGC